VNRDRAVSDRKKREREREVNITFSLSWRREGEQCRGAKRGKKEKINTKGKCKGEDWLSGCECAKGKGREGENYTSKVREPAKKSLEWTGEEKRRKY
jgi:hypothetical protein